MLDQIYSETRELMEKTIDAITREFKTIRTGKATPHLLDTIKVDAYGSKMPINQLGTISAPEPRLLVIQAFDKTIVGEIAKAIQAADLGLNPMVDGQIVRLPVPTLNEERRKELVKHCEHIAEEGRISIRNTRRDINDQLKKAQKAREISEDQEADGHDEIQKMTNEFIEKIDDLLDQKESEVMEV